eukprot:SAG25_NODE_8915_length_397_cov_0.694631_1_plen_78_part_10
MEKRVAAAEEALLGERAARVDALAEASVAKEEQALVEMQVTDLQMRLQEREEVESVCALGSMIPQRGRCVGGVGGSSR